MHIKYKMLTNKSQVTGQSIAKAAIINIRRSACDEVKLKV